jgi:hypothetical protein
LKARRGGGLKYKDFINVDDADEAAARQNSAGSRIDEKDFGKSPEK